MASAISRPISEILSRIYLNIALRDSANPFSNFTPGEKSETWPQCTTMVAFESPSLANGAACLKYTYNRISEMYACPNWQSSVHSPYRKLSYKIGSSKRAEPDRRYNSHVHWLIVHLCWILVDWCAMAKRGLQVAMPCQLPTFQVIYQKLVILPALMVLSLSGRLPLWR